MMSLSTGNRRKSRAFAPLPWGEPSRSGARRYNEEGMARAFPERTVYYQMDRTARAMDDAGDGSPTHHGAQA